MTMLLLSARSTEDNQALWRAAVRAGWNVERVRGITLPCGISDAEIVLYVEALFAVDWFSLPARDRRRGDCASNRRRSWCTMDLRALADTMWNPMIEPRLHEPSWERMIRAVEKVRDRVLRAARALESAGIAYAVVGGNAVADWVSRVDEAAVRNTRDVDIMLRRADLDRAIPAMTKAGFLYRHSSGIDMFLDGPEAKARDAVHIVFAGERVRPDDLLPLPDVDESVNSDQFQVVTLEALVRMKLTSFRRKDQVHLLDMLDIGLIDRAWLNRVPRELAARLQELLDQPD